ncbi:hypothetical protein M0R19_04150 [Candidatus Pacearchaeota archaeon]|nr:hypothetical protein [Candidatus Pacearchaeota archaeon]
MPPIQPTDDQIKNELRILRNSISKNQLNIQEKFKEVVKLIQYKDDIDESVFSEFKKVIEKAVKVKDNKSKNNVKDFIDKLSKSNEVVSQLFSDAIKSHKKEQVVELRDYVDSQKEIFKIHKSRLEVSDESLKNEERDLKLLEYKLSLSDIDGTRAETFLQKQKKLRLVSEAQLRIELKLLEIRRDSLLSSGQKEEAEVVQSQIDAKNMAFAQTQSREDIRSQSLSNIVSQTKKLSTVFTGISDSWKQGIVGGFINTMKVGGSFSDAAKTMLTGMSDIVNFENAFHSAIENVFESTAKYIGETSQLLADFHKNTGAGEEYRQIIYDSSRNMMSYNVGIKEATESATALYENWQKFTTLDKKEQQNIITTTAKFKTFGIEAQNSAEIFSTLSQGFQESTREVTDFHKTLVSASKSIGVSIKTLSADFGKSMTKLAAWGSKGKQIFLELSAASKALGSDMDTMLNLVSKFDTFEGAAESAGHLNAILGGDLLNSMDLLNASESERIRMLLNAVESGERSWQSMGKFERKAIAAAAGIEDMNLANKMFGEGTKGYDEAVSKLDRLTMSEKELQEQALLTASFQDKLNKLIEKFSVIVMPLLNALTWIFDKIAYLSDALGDWFIPVLIGVLYYFHKVTSGLGLMGKLTGLVSKGIDKISGSLGALSEPKGGGLGFLKMAAGMLMLSVAIGILMYSIKNFGGITTFLVALGGLIAFAIGVSVIGHIAGAALSSLGVGFLMLGGGIALMGVGIAVIILSLTLLVNALTDMIGAMGSSGNGISKMAKSLGELFFTLMLLPITTMLIFASSLAMGMEMIAEALDMMPENKLITFTTMLKNVGEIKPESVLFTTQIVDQIERFSRVESETKEEKNNGFSDFIEAINGLKQGNTTGTGNSAVNVILKINDRVFGEAVGEIVENQAKSINRA